MHASRVLQFLSIPAALGLGTALVVACSDGGPTAPDQISSVESATPFTAPKKGGTGGKAAVVDDVDLTCKNNYELRAEDSFTAVYDVNNNDQVCVYTHDSGGGGPKKH